MSSEKLKKEIEEILRDRMSIHPSAIPGHKLRIDKLLSLCKKYALSVLPEKCKTEGDKDAPSIDDDWIRGKQHGFNNAIDLARENINERRN